jgi:hypothetical protein
MVALAAAEVDDDADAGADPAVVHQQLLVSS